MISWDDIKRLPPLYKKYVGLKALVATVILYIPLLYWMKLAPAGIDPESEFKLFFFAFFLFCVLRIFFSELQKRTKKMILNKKTFNVVLTVCFSAFLLSSCASKLSVGSKSGSAGDGIIVDPIQAPTGSNFCDPFITGSCPEEEDAKTIRSVLTAHSDDAGYGTYIYLIITDMTVNKEQIRAATDVFTCNFNSAKHYAHQERETALFVAKTKSSYKGEISTGEELRNAYDLHVAERIHKYLKWASKDVFPVNGFDPNSSLYLLGTYESLHLYLEEDKVIAGMLTRRSNEPSSVEVVPLDHFTPLEVATLFRNLKEMYSDKNVSETESFLNLSRLRETPIRTFLRTALRYIPLPITPAEATEDRVCA